MRNILTGQRIDIVVPPGTFNLECVPAFCIGNAEPIEPNYPPLGEPFIERPDGSMRAPLPGSLPVMAIPVGDGGVLVAPAFDRDDRGNLNWKGLTISDPLTGRAAFADVANLEYYPASNMLGGSSAVGLSGTVIDLGATR